MKKRLTTIAVLFLPALLFAQQKSRDLIKELLYVKISPTLLYNAGNQRLELENSLEPAIFGAIGFKTRYAAVGFSPGYFKWKYGGKITPLGVDLTITDFKQKVFPVITAQWHKAHFEGQHYIGRSSFYVTGKDMYSIAAGGSIRIFKTTKLMVTWGFSKWKCNVKRTYVPREPTLSPSQFYSKDDFNMAFLAASLVW